MRRFGWLKPLLRRTIAYTRACGLVLPDKDQHGRVLAAGAHAADDLIAFHVGQLEVGHDDVVLVVADQLQGFLAVVDRSARICCALFVKPRGV